MNIKFKQIHIENFFSLGTIDLELNDKGYVLVRGCNENPKDAASSNGSGKSSIFDALVWCLTGQTVRGCKDVSNHFSDNGALVGIYFSCGEKNFYIQRTKDHKPEGTNIQIVVDGKDVSGKGIRDNNVLLSEYFPDLSYDLLSSVVVLGQGLPQRFTNNSPVGRKEILEKLSKADFMIADLKNRLENRRGQLQTELRAVQDKQLSLNRDLKNIHESLNTYNSYIEQYNQYKKNTEKEIEQNQTLKKLEQETHNLNSNIVTLSNQLNSVQDKMTKLVTDRDTELNTLLQEQSLELQPLQAEWNNLSNQLFSINKEIEKIESIIDTCPTCGQKIIGIEKPNADFLIKQRISLQDTIAQQEEKLKQLAKHHEKQKQLISKKYEYELNNLNEEIKILTKSMEDNSSQVIRNNSQISKIKQILQGWLEEENKITTQYTIAMDQIFHYEEKSKKIESDILYINSEQDEIEQRLQVISKFSSLAQRDFRGYLLKNIISYINERVKFYSKQVFDNDQAAFYLDGNAIVIEYDGKDYFNLSGGEKQKIDLIVQLSLRDMLCLYLDFSSNIIVFDELFDQLDDIGCEKVLTLISSNLTDIESIYIITHHSSIPVPTDSEIVIVKDQNKTSTVR